MTMSGPKGNPAYKWVEVWYDDWDALKVKYAHAQAAGTPHETRPATCVCFQAQRVVYRMSLTPCAAMVSQGRRG